MTSKQCIFEADAVVCLLVKPLGSLLRVSGCAAIWCKSDSPDVSDRAARYLCRRETRQALALLADAIKRAGHEAVLFRCIVLQKGSFSFHWSQTPLCAELDKSDSS